MNLPLERHLLMLGKRLFFPAGIGVLLVWISFHRNLVFSSLESHKETLLHFSRTHFVEAWLGWGFLYWALTATGIPGAVFLSLMSGFLFGPLFGMALDLTFASLGATTALLLFRHVFFAPIRQRIEETPRFCQILEGFRKNGFPYLLFLRLVPLFPFWLVNVSLSLTEIRPAIFLAGTMIGMIPASALITRLGSSLRNHPLSQPFLTGQQEVLLSLLGLLAVLPVLVRKFFPVGSGQ